MSDKKNIWGNQTGKKPIWNNQNSDSNTPLKQTEKPQFSEVTDSFNSNKTSKTNPWKTSSSIPTESSSIKAEEIQLPKVEESPISENTELLNSSESEKKEELVQEPKIPTANFVDLKKEPEETFSEPTDSKSTDSEPTAPFTPINNLESNFEENSIPDLPDNVSLEQDVSNKQPENNKKNKNGLLIGIIVGAVILIIVLVIVLVIILSGKGVSSNNTEEVAETTITEEISEIETESTTSKTTAKTTEETTEKVTYTTAEADDLNAQDEIIYEENRGSGTNYYNIYNGGFVADDGTNLVYRESDGNLYCQSNGDINLVLNHEVWYINLYGSWIYFYDVTEDALARVRVDGSGYEILVNQSVHEINIVNDTLYYSTNDAMYSSSLTGNNQKKIVSGRVWYMNFLGNRIYYRDADTSSLCAVNIDGSNKTTLVQGQVYEVMVFDQLIYFTHGDDERYLCVAYGEGTEYDVLNNNYTRWTNTDGNYIYYTDFSDYDDGVGYGTSLYRITLNGSYNEICYQGDEEIEGICIIEDKLYYMNPNKELVSVNLDNETSYSQEYSYSDDDYVEEDWGDAVVPFYSCELYGTINSQGASYIYGYSDNYVLYGGSAETVRENIKNGWHVKAVNSCYSNGVYWYELYDADDNDYYGWVDAYYIDFY